MKTPKCKPWICAENECSKCVAYAGECPQDCKFQVLHALDRSDVGWFEKPRRSGKTYKLLECASKLIEAGHDVVIVARDGGIRDYIVEKGKKFGMELFVSTWDTWRQDLVGAERMFVLTDELSLSQVQDIQHDMPGHPFLMGYWTEPIPEWVNQP